MTSRTALDIPQTDASLDTILEASTTTDIEGQPAEDELAESRVDDNLPIATCDWMPKVGRSGAYCRLRLDKLELAQTLTERSPTLQLCFLCLRGPASEQFAVIVGCKRPTASNTRMRRKNGGGTFESDSLVWHKLMNACYEHKGDWKRWIPFYGVVDVREVNFQFQGATAQGNRYPICIHPLNVEGIRELAVSTIHEYKSTPDDFKCSGYPHDSWCPSYGNDDGGQYPCVAELAPGAEQRQKNLDNLHRLRSSARNPWGSNGFCTLEGMAQDSFILEKSKVEAGLPKPGRRYIRNDRFRGVEVVLGWQMDRIVDELPLYMAGVLVFIAVVWLGVVLGGIAGDFSISTAVGQLVVASVALLLMVLRRG